MQYPVANSRETNIGLTQVIGDHGGLGKKLCEKDGEKEDDMTIIRPKTIKVSDGNGTFSAGAPQYSPFSLGGWWLRAAESYLKPSGQDPEQQTMLVAENCEVHIGEGSLADARAFAHGEFEGLQIVEDTKTSDVTGYWGTRRGGQVVYALYFGTIMPQEEIKQLIFCKCLI